MDDNERSRHLEVFLGKGVLKICSKLTGEHRAEVQFKLSCKAVSRKDQAKEVNKHLKATYEEHFYNYYNVITSIFSVITTQRIFGDKQLTRNFTSFVENC